MYLAAGIANFRAANLSLHLAWVWVRVFETGVGYVYVPCVCFVDLAPSSINSQATQAKARRIRHVPLLAALANLTAFSSSGQWAAIKSLIRMHDVFFCHYPRWPVRFHILPSTHPANRAADKQPANAKNVCLSEDVDEDADASWPEGELKAPGWRAPKARGKNRSKCVP